MAGMGMASSSKKKKSGSKKKKGSNGGSFDVSKSMMKSDKAYDDLMKEAYKALDEDHQTFGEVVTTEYVIAARLNPEAKKSSIQGAASLSDWVPVSQLCITRPVESYANDESAQQKDRLQKAISFYCREISYAACLGSSLFKSIPRNLLQYSAEEKDSFFKFVYEDVIEGKNSNAKDINVMTKAQAREVLQLSEDCNNLNEIKRSYRKLSMKLHPDRFVGIERTDDEIEKSKEDFAKVKIAYESLNSGIRISSSDDTKVRSWYESLGGRSRTDFVGPIDLISVENAKGELERMKYKCAVAVLDPEIVMAFVARNQMSSS